MSIIETFLLEQGYSKEQVRLTLKAWKLTPMMKGDHQVGEIMMQNNEAHFALDHSFRLKMGRGKYFKQCLKNLVDEHGFIVTKLFKGDKNKRLIELMGFRQIAEDAKTETFWIDEELLNARN
jgi:uncharacterized protein Yka (UPF0111/DUF47 family)